MTTIHTAGHTHGIPASAGGHDVDPPVHLTDGWDPDTPVGDTMVRRYLANWSALVETFVRAGGGQVHQTDRYHLADLGRPSGFFDAVTLLRPMAPSDLDDVLDEVEARTACGRGDLHLWSAWPTPDLRRRGWELEGHPPLLVRPPATLAAPPSPPDVRLAAVTDPTGLARWEQVAAEGYPLPEVDVSRPGTVADTTLLDDPRLHLALGLDEDGSPVSLGSLFVEAGIGCFALGVTLPEHRRRGHWAAHAIRRIHTRPDLWMAGVFSDDSRPSAEQLGFVPIQRMTLWTLPRP